LKDYAKEPLFTAKGWAALALLGCVYAAILFSMDPEWIAWAAPLAFGGALYAPGPTPASVQIWSPGDVMSMAYLFSVGSLVALALVAATTEKSRSVWSHWLQDRFHRGGIIPLRSHGKPKSAPSH
jgi:hypothetical protein